MNIKEYQEKAIRTLAKLESPKLDLAHAVLGMGSEEVELFEYTDTINKLEEIGDMFWYLASYCHLRSLELSEFVKFPRTTFDYDDEDNKKMIKRDLINFISQLQDIVKKYIAYNKEIDMDRERVVLIVICRSLVMYGKLTKDMLFSILDKNINKLAIRYPDKYSDTLAVNRDLEAEYNSLSS